LNGRDSGFKVLVEDFFKTNDLFKRCEIVFRYIWPLLQTEQFEFFIGSLINEARDIKKKYGKIECELLGDLQEIVASLQLISVENQSIERRIEGLTRSKTYGPFIVGMYCEIDEITDVMLASSKEKEIGVSLRNMRSVLLRSKERWLQLNNREEELKGYRLVNGLGLLNFLTFGFYAMNIYTNIKYKESSIDKKVYNFHAVKGCINIFQRAYLDDLRAMNNELNYHILYLTNAKLEECVQRLVRKMFFLTENSQPAAPSTNKFSISSCSIRLLDSSMSSYLLLDIERECEQKIETKILRVFKKEDGKDYKIAKSLLVEKNNSVKTSKTVSHFLLRTNLNRLLGKFFFPRIPRSLYAIEKWYTKVIFDPSVDSSSHGKRTLIMEISDEEKVDLLMEIENLEDFKY